MVQIFFFFDTLISKTINLCEEVKWNNLLELKLDNWFILKYFDLPIFLFLSTDLWLQNVSPCISTFNKVTKLVKPINEYWLHSLSLFWLYLYNEILQ